MIVSVDELQCNETDYTSLGGRIIMQLTRLRELREDRHLSQQALADLVNTSQQNIHKYENGITEPDIQMLKTLASVFHTSIDYLVEYDPEEYPELLATIPANDMDYKIKAPLPHSSEHVNSSHLHLLMTFDKCREPIRENILCIMQELADSASRSQ